MSELKYSMSLQGKVAIITGASKGIGASIAWGFARQGAAVVLSSRKQEAVKALAEEINSAGLQAFGCACDVGHEDQIINLVQTTVDQFGSIDIVVNNAATNPVFGKVQEADSKLFDKVMNVNVKGCMLLSNLCYPYMKQRGGGSVINIASVEGLKPSFGLGLYSVSKAALIMLTKSQAKEWGRSNIRSNAICPGLIKTKFSASIWSNESVLKQFEGHLPLGRMAEPEEMVGMAIYLASDASSYTTGGVFTSDGGHMIAG